MVISQGKVVMKEISNTQYIASMNPTAGSFDINARLQRHFVPLAVHMPGLETIRFKMPLFLIMYA